MGRRPRNNTEIDAAVLQRLRELGGEAIRDGLFFRAGGFNIADAVVMGRMARNGHVVIETVGASTFAKVAEEAPCRS